MRGRSGRGMGLDGRRGDRSTNCPENKKPLMSEWWRGLWALLWILGWAPALGAREVTLVAYNLENYRIEVSGSNRPKTESARAAVAQSLVALRPDLIGVCEMGSREALEELRGRLRAAGLDFPELEWVPGPDPERHLALLSRYPIRLKQSRERVAYELNGMPQLVRRGFLDVTVECAPRTRLRLVGAHLKSRLPAPEGQEEIRRREARLLREHVDGILRQEPGCRLAVYGDFNDTREQPSIREIMGVRGGEMALQDVAAEDDLGDRWTYYWRAGDVYSRIDYILVSRGLRASVLWGTARVGRDGRWREASDHRPVSVRFRVPEE
jgi:endonuclease/exonuclease/phosphatase family metal-dependent hydrolase